MATARQCDGRRKISASKRWLFVKCKYLEAVEVENMEEPPKCLVEHPGFQAVFLNYWVLRAAWQYKQQYGALAYEESDHKKSRHIAFRPWKGHRSYITVLDSCAVKCIRPHFQEPERLEDEMEFTGFHCADE